MAFDIASEKVVKGQGKLAMQLLPNELALANLRQEIPCDERGYCTAEEAYEWLKELSGVDYGFDVDKWEKWVSEQNKSVPSKLDNY
jgi:hypothetical protein